jgi:hypothetical protein
MLLISAIGLPWNAMLPKNRTLRITVGLALLLGAAALFAGLLSLGSEAVTLGVGAVDLVLGLWLLASGLRLPGGRSPEAN